MEVAEKIKQAGLKNVMVSNGFINEKPLADLLNVIDAFNIDLKSFSDAFYINNTGSKLKPVKIALKQIAKSDKHLEITTLIITNENDDVELFTKMIDWIASELGQNVVLHITRYFPNYQLNSPKTPIETLVKLMEIAKRKLENVYLGNV